MFFQILGFSNLFWANACFFLGLEVSVLGAWHRAETVCKSHVNMHRFPVLRVGSPGLAQRPLGTAADGLASAGLSPGGCCLSKSKCSLYSSDHCP